jgi:lauroyl/myristoyl acyltransferase
MNQLIYIFMCGVVKLLQILPLKGVAFIGRVTGAVAFWLDGRHRRVALENLTRCFGDQKSRAEIRAIALENFRRLGENFSCFFKIYTMPWEKLKKHVELVGMDKVLSHEPKKKTQPVILALGHFGNFELCAHFGRFIPPFTFAATYRALHQPALNRVTQSLRELSGCKFFERRTGGRALRDRMSNIGSLLGLFADQHAGEKGLRLPFLGHECSTSNAAAIFALRYRCPLHTSICYRIGLGKWRIENGDEIPTMENGRRRDPAEIMRDVNHAFEIAVRRDPANWFWVHRRWKLSEELEMEMAKGR